MSELSSLPSSSSVAKGLNLSSLLSTATNLNCSPVYGIPSYQNSVIVLGKPTNTALPLLLPVRDATVDVASPTSRRWITNNYGIAAIGCFTQANIEGYTVIVRHPKMNFDGKGIGQWSSLIYRSVFDIRKPIIIQGDIDIPCIVGAVPTPIISGLNLGSVPSINIGVPAFDVGDYGRVFPSNTQGGIVLSIYINDTKVLETTKTNDTSTIFNFPGTLQNVLTGETPLPAPLKPGSTISVYAIATMGSCQQKSQVTTVYIPVIPVIPTPSELCAAISTRLNSAAGKITPPSIIIPGITSALEISGLEDFCKSDPSNTKFITPANRTGYISLDGKQLQFDVYAGRASIDLSKLITAPTTPTQGKDTPFSQATSVASIQSYLPIGYFVPGDNFDTMRGTYFKIIRPNKSYYWAHTFTEVEQYLRS